MHSLYINSECIQIAAVLIVTVRDYSRASKRKKRNVFNVAHQTTASTHTVPNEVPLPYLLPFSLRFW